jgi:site-specific recombinase XerC
MNGTPLRTVAELLGHKSLTMVHRYSHLSPDHLRDAVDRLSNGAKLVQTECLPSHGIGTK